MDLDATCDELIRAVNLVAFDVCDPRTRTYIRDADPLKVTARWSLRGPIADTLHTPLRKMIRQQVAARGMSVGRIELNGSVAITLYLRALRGPAYRHEESDSEL